MLKKITLKLFFITTVMIMVLIGSMLFIQSSLFENYYINKRSDLLEKYNNEVLDIYSNGDPLSIEKLTESYEYANKYNLQIQYVPAEALADLEKTLPKESDQSNTTTYNTITFKTKDLSDSGYISYSISSKQLSTEQLQFGQQLYYNNKASMDSGKSVSGNMLDSYGNRNLMYISSIDRDGKSSGLLYVLSPLRSISEISSIMGDYYSIFFLAAFAVVLLLSFVFSCIVTKPLLHMNAVASRIADLDFSQKCKITSKDELGNLSLTINNLSNNLSRKIVDLNGANKRLGRNQ
jgi:methyl-accepting chemotaxis protein